MASKGKSANTASTSGVTLNRRIRFPERIPAMKDIQIRYLPLKLVLPEPKDRIFRKFQEEEARKIVCAALNQLAYGLSS
jgi:hypothetical protein